MLDETVGWKFKVRVSIEREGEKILGPGRVELLGHIDRQRSIAGAAKQMNMSYRRAWGLVRDMNENAGAPLVELTTGGSGGGGATLTPLGKEALAHYQRFVERVAQVTAEFNAQHFRK